MIDQNQIVVTGAGGMLAAAFRKRMPQARFVSKPQLDITDPAAIDAFFEANKPLALINCAAYTHVDRAETEVSCADRINGESVGLLSQACRQFGAKLIHFSTDYVFDGSLRRPLKPDDPVGPQGAYGRSKLLGEQVIQQGDLQNWLIIRTAWLYGDGACFPRTMLKAANAGKSLKVVSDQIGSPTFTDDLAEATLNLLDAGANGVFHLTNSGQTSWFDFAKAIFEEFDVKADLSPATSAQWKELMPQSAIRPAYSVLDTSKYTQATGKQLPDWRDALRRYRDKISA